MLLLADWGKTARVIAEAMGGQPQTVEPPRPGGRPKRDATQEASRVALAGSAPPEGQATGTMQRWADRLGTRAIVETISDETVRRTLNKQAPAVAKGVWGHPHRRVRFRLADGSGP